LQVQQPKVVAPQQLKPQPVGAVVGTVLALKGFQIGIDLRAESAPLASQGENLLE
jgi:hypothetical protein